MSRRSETLGDEPQWTDAVVAVGREQLVNIMHTITEDALWTCDSVPEAQRCKPMGIFGMIESPRTVPHVAIPSDWYGCLPLSF